MGRKKKNVLESCWKGVEMYLRHEAEIRQAAKDERAGLSFLNSISIGAGGKGGKRSDRTAALAIKKTMELPAVVLENGETVKRPETWLSIFEKARRLAAKENQYTARWILDVWKTRFNEGGRFIDELFAGELDRELEPDNYIFWIIEKVEELAIKAGLMKEEGALVYGRGIRFLKTCPPQRLD